MSQRSIFSQRSASQEEEEKPKSTNGMSRKGASSAKPAREAAGSVRVVSVKKDRDGFTQAKGMTKEEKKALRKKEREEDDQVASLTNMVMKNNENYRKNRRLWWVFMVVGIVLCALTFVGTYSGGAQGSEYDLSTPLGIFTVAALVLAYVFIIAAFVWDWMKIRPIRNETTDQIRGMSEKRRRALVEACYAEEAERKLAKKKEANENTASK